MKKRYFKLLVLGLVVWQTIFITAYPVVAYAQEVEIQTGDVAAESVSAVDANVVETEVVTEIPQDVSVETDQTASVTTETAADGDSGDIEAGDSEGDILAETGDAEAVSVSDNLTNVNDVSVTTSTDSGSLESTTDQEANIDSTVDADSTSGDVEVGGLEVDALTGDATSIADNINSTNINSVGANTLIYSDTIVGEVTGDINLNDLYQSMVSEGSSLPQETMVSASQTAEVSTQTLADSVSGEINVDSASGEVGTGDVASVANSVNLTNLNLVGTSGIIFIINVVGSLLGDILIPNLDQMGSVALPAELEAITNQNALVAANTVADSNSGSVSTTGEGSAETGDAASVANTTSYVNLVKIGDVWVWLLINNYGNWDGSLVNWEEPGAVETLASGTTVLEKDEDADNFMPGSLTVITDQEAVVNSETNANSGSGDIELTGDSNAKTGNAFSLANSFSLTNFVGIGGSFIFGILNILGSWAGDLNVAYPDLEIALTDNKDTITAGSSQQYSITVTNKGKSKIKGVDIGFSAPAEFQIGSSELNHHLDELKAGETFSYNIEGSVAPTALANTQINAVASVTSPQEEESKENNQAGDSTLVVLPNVSASDPDKRTPELKIEVKNNVNDFVYPGDTVLASITVVNQSPFMAHGVKVKGYLSNDHPMPAIPMDWDLGDFKPGEKVIIDFSIGLIESLPEGHYYLSAEAKGKSESGDESSSGISTSAFFLKLRYYADILVPEVLAVKDDSVLGVSNTNPQAQNFLVDNKKYLPYILATSFVLFFLVRKARKKLEEK